MKTCSKCKVKKDLFEFPKHKNSKDGLYCQCKSCKKEWKLNNKDKVKEEKKRWRLNNKDKVNKEKKEYTKKIKDKPKIIISDKKTCSKCKIQKPYSDFVKCNTRLDGHYPQCRECKAEYRKENQHVIKKYTEKYKEKNKYNTKNWRINNLERWKEIQNKSRDKNKNGKSNSKSNGKNGKNGKPSSKSNSKNI